MIADIVLFENSWICALTVLSHKHLSTDIADGDGSDTPCAIPPEISPNKFATGTHEAVETV